MSTLLIRDLTHTEALDDKALRAVRGGMLPLFPVSASFKVDNSFSATQLIGQTQSVINENGNNVAFATDIDSRVKPTQTASNNINFGYPREVLPA
jgi:hypothetical protein